mgnify:CR=1 FL=1|jgi:hypothetical protein
MDFQYNFRQAHNDRLEDAGIKRYGYQNTDGYVLENDEQPKRKAVAQQVKRVLIATVQLLVK